MRRIFTILVAFSLLAPARATDELPQHSAGEAMDFEPGLLPDLGPAPEPPLPPDSPAQLEATIERAKKSAASGERLFRAGIIAKVEAEKRALKVVRLTFELAIARLETTKTELDAKRADFDAGKLTQAQLDAAQASADAAASTAWQRAELAAAELNLSRQRQLLAAGLGSKSLVARAQSQVAGLKSKPAPPPETPR